LYPFLLPADYEARSICIDTYLKSGTVKEVYELAGLTGKDILEKVKKAGYKVGNVSISVEAKKPRLSLDQIKKIKKSTAEILEINIACVGLTFTSGEDLTAFGQGKAIQAFSMVTLSND